MIISDIAFYRFAALQSGFAIPVQKNQKIVKSQGVNAKKCKKIYFDVL